MKKQSLNKEWHLKNKMPVKATIDQRIEWHLEHIKYCGCRGIPEKLIPEIRKRKLMSKQGFEMKKKAKPKKKKIRIPLPKQRPKVKESKKIYNRKKSKKIEE